MSAAPRARPFVWVDAFTRERMGGNPCAVVFDADDIPEETRLAFTRETRLSECAFVVESAEAAFGARYYLQSHEIKMAGHPTVATVTALLDRGLLRPGAETTLEVGAGVLPISVSADGRVTMTQAAPVFGPEADPEATAAALGLSPADIAAPPQVVSTGTGFLVAWLTTHHALRRIERRDADVDALRTALGGGFLNIFAATAGGATPAGDTFARLRLAPPDPDEDPFTGAATGCLGAYLWSRGLIESPRFVAEQGHWMERPGQAQVEVLGPPDAIAGVNVSGAGAVLMRGEVIL